MFLFLLYSSIHRVLPLPSFEWGDLSSEFFCHAHSHTPTTLPTPSAGDLLVGRDKMETRFSSLAAVLCDGIKVKKMFSTCLATTCNALARHTQVRYGSFSL